MREELGWGGNVKSWAEEELGWWERARPSQGGSWLWEGVSRDAANAPPAPSPAIRACAAQSPVAVDLHPTYRGPNAVLLPTPADAEAARSPVAPPSAAACAPSREWEPPREWEPRPSRPEPREERISPACRCGHVGVGTWCRCPVSQYCSQSGQGRQRSPAVAHLLFGDVSCWTSHRPLCEAVGGWGSVIVG